MYKVELSVDAYAHSEFHCRKAQFQTAMFTIGGQGVQFHRSVHTNGHRATQ